MSCLTSSQNAALKATEGFSLSAIETLRAFLNNVFNCGLLAYLRSYIMLQFLEDQGIAPDCNNFFTKYRF